MLAVMILAHDQASTLVVQVEPVSLAESCAEDRMC